MMIHNKKFYYQKKTTFVHSRAKRRGINTNRISTLFLNYEILPIEKIDNNNFNTEDFNIYMLDNYVYNYQIGDINDAIGDDLIEQMTPCMLDDNDILDIENLDEINFISGVIVDTYPEENDITSDYEKETLEFFEYIKNVKQYMVDDSYMMLSAKSVKYINNDVDENINNKVFNNNYVFYNQEKINKYNHIIKMVLVEIHKHSQTKNIYLNSLKCGYKFITNEIFDETKISEYWDTRDSQNSVLKPVNIENIVMDKNAEQKPNGIGYALIDVTFSTPNYKIRTNNRNSFTEYYKFVGLINYLNIKIKDKRIGIRPKDNDWTKIPIELIKKGYLEFFNDLQDQQNTDTNYTIYYIYENNNNNNNIHTINELIDFFKDIDGKIVSHGQIPNSINYCIIPEKLIENTTTDITDNIAQIINNGDSFITIEDNPINLNIIIKGEKFGNY